MWRIFFYAEGRVFESRRARHLKVRSKKSEVRSKKWQNDEILISFLTSYLPILISILPQYRALLRNHFSSPMTAFKRCNKTWAAVRS